MQFIDAKKLVAKAAGDSRNPDAVRDAGDAIKAAIRDWNSEHNWEFKFMEEPSFTIDGGTADIVIPNLKRAYTVRLISPAFATLSYQRLREQDWFTPETPAGTPAFYTHIDNGEQTILRVYPASSDDMAYYVRYYAHIAEPETDEEELDVPKRYLNALLCRAKYHMCLDAYSDQADRYETLSVTLMMKAIRDDKKQPDEREQFTARMVSDTDGDIF